MIDLHTHTVSSDGTLTLEELVGRAEKAGLTAIAITDHDTVRSARRIPELEASIEVIPGIEISVYDDELDYIDIHMLGLLIDPEDPRLLSTLERLGKEREAQKKAIIERLNGLGYRITYGEARKKAQGSFGRPHIARVLIERYPDEFSSIQEVFDKLLDQGKPAFESRTAFFTLHEAIDLVHSAGGLAILAHPLVYGYGLDKLLSDFKGLGGDGIETVYDYARNYPRVGYSEKDNIRIGSRMRGIAERMGFLESGGSDYHGPNKGSPLGSLDVPDAFLERLKAASKPF